MTKDTGFTAKYIGDMSLELAEMARKGGLELLAHVLELAAHEAYQDRKLPDGRISAAGMPDVKH
jgi:hypothetical protein